MVTPIPPAPPAAGPGALSAGGTGAAGGTPTLADAIYRASLLEDYRRPSRAWALGGWLLSLGLLGGLAGALARQRAEAPRPPRPFLAVDLQGTDLLEESPGLPPPQPGSGAPAPRVPPPPPPVPAPDPPAAALPSSPAPSPTLGVPGSSEGSGGSPGGVPGGRPGGVAGAPSLGAGTPAPEPVTPPRADAAYLRNPRPAYPAFSRRAGETGTVILRVRVAADGRVLEAEIRQSSGFPRLDQAALEAVRRWTFLPARRGPEAIEAWVLVPITFSLNT